MALTLGGRCWDWGTQLASTEELVDGVSQGPLGEVLIRYGVRTFGTECGAGRRD